MAIPYATTRITLLRRADPDDAYESDLDGDFTYLPVVSGVRAVLGQTSGASTFAGGERSDSLCRFACDPIGVTTLDILEDELTNLRWQVTAVAYRTPAEGILAHDSGQGQRWEGVAG